MQKLKRLDDELLGILAAWGLQSEESWLIQMGVRCVGDFEFLEEDDFKGRNPSLKHLVAAMKARK